MDKPMECLTRERMQQYLDGGFSPIENRGIETHLASCPECRRLHARVRGFDSVLRACAPIEGRRPERAAGCPDAETIAALMDGSMPGGAERAGVAAHVAECPACAARAADAAETTRIVGEIERRGLERPPRGLARAVRERLCPREPMWLGEITASIRDLFERLAARAGAVGAGPAYAAIAETGAAYGSERRLSRRPMKGETAESPSRRKHRTMRKGTKGEHPRGAPLAAEPGAASPAVSSRPGEIARSFRCGDLAVYVALAAAGERVIRCTVRIADGRGDPLASVPVEMRKGTASLHLEPTGPGGEAVFGDLVAGNYQFFIRRGEGARVGVTLN